MLYERYLVNEGVTPVSELILCEEHDPIATLTLNRPEKRNAMSPDLLLTMRNHLRRMEA
ncbi:hypothetical protein NKDENANG_03829 [Candidatus Entotheonellaceae bacterium PAL068K]